MVFDTIKTMDFLKLQTALASGRKEVWETAIASSGYKEGSLEYTKLTAALHADNTEARAIITQYVTHISSSDTFKGMTQEETK